VLIVFTDVETPAKPSAAAGKKPAPVRGRSEDTTQVELRQRVEDFQTLQEEMQTSQEELKSTNEELQSTNEELQSTNEELTTSREEMQSMNEELQTVNHEQQAKMDSLAETNSDMKNLMNSTDIATVFLTKDLCLRRFTSQATKVIRLLPGDTGRPITDIVSDLNYPELAEDASEVLRTLVPIEKRVSSRDGRWYMARVMPYRTVDDVIDGLVITFVDVTESLRKTNDLLRLAVVVRDAHDAVTVQDMDGRIIAWNRGAVRMYGWSEDEALRMNVRDRIPKGLQEEALLKVHQLSLTEIIEPYRTQRITKTGAIVEVWMTATALVDEAGKMYAIATTERARELTTGQATGAGQ
jgi:two-component system, chemotaxis family, CheB/CheR fusion protein